MRRRRTAQEIEELLENYRVSGMTRIAYCQQVGIALSTLGRYLRQWNGTAATGKSEAGCGRDGATPVIGACAEQRAADRERLEVPDADLARLIRVAEAQ